MKIGLITQWFPPEHGSAALPGTISEALSRAGHDVRVVTGYPNYPEGQLQTGWKQRWRFTEMHGDVTIHRTPLYISHDNNPMRRMLNYLSFALSATWTSLRVLRDVDVVWVHATPALPALPAMVLKRIAGVPFVLHIQDLWPDTVTASGMLPLRTARFAEATLGRFCKWSYAAASAIGIIAPSMRETLEDRGVPTEKLLDIPNWANETVFRPVDADSSFRENLGIPDGFVAMYAGAVGDVQGLETLIQAAERVQRDAIQVVIVGDGVAREKLKMMATEMALDNLTFIDPQPFASMSRVLAAADVQVVCLQDLPLYRITLPSKVQATLASGRPIIVSAGGDAERVVKEAGAGLSAKAGDPDALASALRLAAQSPPHQLSAWGAAGRRHYESHFSERVGVRRMITALSASLEHSDGVGR